MAIQKLRQSNTDYGCLLFLCGLGRSTSHLKKMSASNYLPGAVITLNVIFLFGNRHQNFSTDICAGFCSASILLFCLCMHLINGTQIIFDDLNNPGARVKYSSRLNLHENLIRWRLHDSLH